ncbi:hypothetical protein Tco_0583992 [Tanacetum coccineum]
MSLCYRTSVATACVMAISVISVSSDSVSRRVGTAPLDELLLVSLLHWCSSMSSHGLAPEAFCMVGPYHYHLNCRYNVDLEEGGLAIITYRIAGDIRLILSSNHFSSDDSLIDSSSSSSSKTSSDSSANALSDSASSHSSYDHSLPTPSSGMRPSHHLCSLVPSIHRSSDAISHDSSSASPSRKRSRSHIASVPLSSPTLGALSYSRANPLPSPKRIRSSKSATDLEGCLEDSFKPYVLREAGLGVDFEDESSELSRSRGDDLEEDVDVVRSYGIDIDPKIQVEIDERIAFMDALRDRGIDARVIVEAID